MESLISKKKESNVSVIVGRPTPITPFTRPPKKKINNEIKNRLPKSRNSMNLFRIILN